MLEKIHIIKQRFDEVNDLIIQPDIISDQQRYTKLMKEYKDLKLIVDKGEIYKEALDNISEAEEIIADGSDAEMLDMAKLQLDEAKETIDKLEEEIRLLLSENYINPFVQIRVTNQRVIIFPGKGDAQVVGISNANTSLLEATALAGGIRDEGRANPIK